jgi:hypothetical protein
MIWDNTGGIHRSTAAALAVEEEEEDKSSVT